MMRQIHYALICCDLDPDRALFGAADTSESKRLEWRGANESFKFIHHLRQALAKNGSEFRLNWFMRADSQIGALCGDESHVIREFEAQWKFAIEHGDGVGWHPHTWRWNGNEDCWFQETTDLQWIAGMLRRSFKSFSVSVGTQTPFARMGWAFHCNTTMKTFDELGVVADLSCVPKMRCHGGALTGPRVNIYDWIGSPDEPFHPGVNDYRRPNDCPNRSLQLMEIPMTTFTVPLLSKQFFRGLVPLARKPMHRFPNQVRMPALRRSRILFATARHSTFKAAVGHLETQDLELPYVGCYFHPDELLDPILRDNFRNNMCWLSSTKVEFLNVPSFVELCEQEDGV